MFRLFRSSVRSLFLLSLLLCWLPAQSQTEQKPAFISDALVVYLHSGPGNQYRIVGTLAAGSSVVFLSEDNNYAQIQYEEDKTAWLPKEHLTFTPGLNAQLSELTATFQEQSSRLNSLEQGASQLQATLDQVTLERDLAVQELEQLRRNNERLTTELNATQASFWQQPMTIGGVILTFGLVFGLLLPKLIPSRRNSDRWM
ncbi:TIGR04211 family SH3 domain-containing protein [Alishewanella sp. 16-MA]|uniref:TIGR04211 family SH3 domain-containing protein n=1 Tax=Alishewanella maricola TaxID=2795740 RepID=A0ABS8C5P2_9ALTE|nr:TIGR04211 family SH3 domain-containing protein [Alishewanella maricola]MCB5227669.1 TIGR04211 family SH3 domain-containing protein [Alishewanella maricola]MDP4944283.1 TIGR04211 family SH3 domain-containing protein [Alishewanella sp.]MDP5185608.1 TIGR04211 family SH3 domain-containing protein [Alishewanella sp.]